MKRLLAALLCGTVIVSSGNFTQTVYATEAAVDTDVTDDELSEEIVLEGEDAPASEAEEGEEPSDEAAEETSEESDEATEETTEESEEEAEGSEEAAETEDAAKDADKEKTDKEELPEGIQGLPEGATLSDLQKELKSDAQDHDVLDTFEDLTEGSDYVSDEVIALADSQEEAEAIAYAYSGELTDYSYGVATISLKDSGLTVGEAFEYALDDKLGLPYVGPNYITHIDQPEDDVDLDEAVTLFATGSDEVASGDGFSEWWDDTSNKDPYLNPANGTYQWHHGMINTYSAWGVTTGSSNVTVAVIDTGVNSNHADLSGKVDTSKGKSFADDTNTTSSDVQGHGTHVAGIIAASLNGKLGAGVAPGVKIISVRVCDAGGSYPDSSLIKALNYVSGATTGTRLADIANMSLGTMVYNPELERTVNKAYDQGLTMVAAMGNQKNSDTKEYPAGYKHMIAVASVNSNGLVSWFSSVGPWADVAAPGSAILSCDNANTGAYIEESGTSMATPVVAGACALYMSAVGHVDPDTMEKVIKKSVSGSAGAGTGTGILDLAKLFDGDTTAPKITLKVNSTVLGEAENGKSVTISNAVAPSSQLSFTAMNFDGSASSNSNTSIVYTTDGKAPSVRDGEILHGEKYTGAVPVSEIVGSITDKTKVTVKAMAVTGMGVAGKVSTLVFTVDPALATSGAFKYSVKITNAPTQLVAGKSIQLEAAVSNAETGEAVSQKVTWKIKSTSGDLSKAKIDAGSGKLTTAAGQTGTLTISCTTADGVTEATASIKVVALNPVNKMVINEGKALELSFDENGNVTGTATAKLTTLTDSKNNDLLAGGSYKNCSFQWTSSNSKVVAVSGTSTGAGVSSVTLKVVSAGTSTLTCKALDGSGKSAKLSVKVTSAAKVQSVTIKNADEFVKMFAGKTATVEATQTFADGVKGHKIPTAWTSSNAKVLKVTDLGNNKATFTAISKGSATVTCAAQDGSGKKATLKVTVLQPVKEITVTGSKDVARGGKSTFKASVLPSTANDKKVYWRITGDITGVTLSGKDGTVEVSNSAKVGGKVTVIAQAQDGSGVEGKVTFTITDAQATGISIVTTETANDRNILVKKDDAVSSFRVYDINVPGSSSVDERNFVLTRKVQTSSSVNANVDVVWSSSNESVATVEDIGSGKARVTGKKAGTATITCTTADGSNKKASTKVTVITPASDVFVTAGKSVAQSFDCYYVGCGVKMPVSVKLGDAYGKASVTQTTTTYEIGRSVPRYSGDSLVGIDFVKYPNSDELVRDKYFCTYSGGKLSIKSIKKFAEDMDKAGVSSDSVAIRVIASSTDGTGLTGSIFFSPVVPTTRMQVRTYDSQYHYTVYDGSYVSLSKYKDTGCAVGSVYSNGQINGAFSVTSSNDDICSGSVIYGSDYPCGNLLVIYPRKKGKATVTVTALDGTGKKTSYIIVVR